MSLTKLPTTTQEPYTWWTPPTERTAYVLHTGRESVSSTLQIPAHFVLCDLCNESVTLRPVPIIYANYATCPTFFRNATGISIKDAAILGGITLVSEK